MKDKSQADGCSEPAVCESWLDQYKGLDNHEGLVLKFRVFLGILGVCPNFGYLFWGSP